MLERSPPRFDHGVRARDLDLRKYATESAGLDKLVDGLGPILHAAVGEQSRRTVSRVDTTSSLAVAVAVAAAEPLGAQNVLYADFTVNYTTGMETLLKRLSRSDRRRERQEPASK